MEEEEEVQKELEGKEKNHQTRSTHSLARSKEKEREKRKTRKKEDGWWREEKEEEEEEVYKPNNRAFKGSQ